MLRGEADIAGAAEFPFIRAVFQGDPISIIACHDKFENDYIIGRKDRGIENIADLRGKRIGVALGTVNEFFLGRFLRLHGIAMEDIIVVNLDPDQFVSAITGGEIDAIMAWQPHVHQIQNELDNTVIWPAQSNQPVFGILTARNEWLTQHAGTVERFLNALKEAEEYLVLHSEEAKTIVREKLNYDSEYISNVWPQHQFSLSLDQSLIVAMKDEADWIIENNLTKTSRIPNFLDHIYTAGLEATKPEAVDIIR